MSFKQDLHMHSWFSDGIMSPAQLVDKYARDEYDVIAITDHEVVDGIMEAELLGKDKNLRVISGIEFVTMFDDLELHILGYYFDRNNKELKVKLRELAKNRSERNEKILDAFNEMGIDIDEDDLITVPGQRYVGKPHFARALVAKGYITEEKEAYEEGKFLESPQVKAIDNKRISTQEAIDLIKGAGGIAVLAHPRKIKGIGEPGSDEFKSNFEKLARNLKKMGVKGIECIYPTHTEEDRWFFVNVAGKLHMHVTEGSDFHGKE